MYYCLSCKTTHLKNESAQKIFQSGYILVSEQKVPLGLCAGIASKKKMNIIPKTRQTLIKALS